MPSAKQENQGTKSTSDLKAKKEARAAERQEAFKRLAIKRVNKAIKALTMVGNLGAYKPSIAQLKAVEDALATAHNDTMKRLKNTVETVGSFSL